ncbi:uncharacterized protein LOC126262718 isoform X2 [Schistocerca nitens]|uniref:uncharacterized protein LOC126262718 isoform X2 n=1 Tax=Schistocerca nitens TaxID=7011 RepID=UPI0021185E06|nr:uncharacterized protein LOC126262718 isoform X2 [Schistocerca nitens]
MTRLVFVITAVFALHTCLDGGGCLALRGVKLWVPEAVRAGSRVRLLCDYDLEQAALYSIKWYRGDQEFYRYVPKESPPTRVFALPGVNVDVSLSDEREVTLEDVQPRLTGEYKCEVSADAPLFHTDIKTAHMTVVDAPTEAPLISVERQRDYIVANCTSRPSVPAANISWLINSHQIPNSAPTVVSDAGGGRKTSWSSLQLAVASLTYPEAVMRLRCVAAIFKVYRRSSESVELVDDAPQIASVLGHSRSGAGRAYPAMVFAALVLSATSR